MASTAIRTAPLSRGGRLSAAAFCAVVALCFGVAPATAGQLYGQITVGGRSVSGGVPVRVTCGRSPSVVAQTDRFGAYQIYVRGSGRCELAVDYRGDRITAPVVSYGNPVRYNFEIVGRGGGARLIRR